ncbi:MAG: bshC [Bacteroidota bacterium]|nr:bshC [Bacteroidota bacterium]
MKITNFPFSETHQFSKLMMDYLDKHSAVREFYKYDTGIDEIEKVIQDKIQLTPVDADKYINRELLVETIKKQYQSLSSIPDKVSENIQALENSITFCIVTAHQLNIFGGPLYYIYKIAQTISTCRQLREKYQNNNFVPVYWMGSEDHDFEEINHIYLYNKKIEWTDKQRGATGDYSTESLLPLIDDLEKILGDGEYSKTLINIFKRAYTQPTLSAAARFLVNELFGEYGLVIVDGNDKNFKHEFSGIMKDELLNRNSFRLVNEQVEKLVLKGHEAQAFPREINLFYLSGNSRERIEYNTSRSKYEIRNTDLSFTVEEIIAELEKHAERFSPNVILRPLFQQKILPSLAYIGGAGELCYWLQLKTVFDFYEINFPQLLLRNSAMLVNENLSRKIEKMGFSVMDFFKETEQLKKDFISKNTEQDIDLSGLKKNIETEFSKLQDIVKSVDASLIQAVGAEMQKSLQSIEGIEKRILKSLKQRNETELNQIEKIKNLLFPENSMQERTDNFSTYYAKYGQQFIDDLITNFDVYNKQFLVIELI